MNQTNAAEGFQPDDRRASWISLGFEHLVTSAIGQGHGSAANPWDVLIVGSGYGGAMAAAALAGATHQGAPGKKATVCVLERGQEYLEGSFPGSIDELPGHIRFTSPKAAEARGQLQGLFDVRLGDHLNVLVANGLGGGSLINAGVMLPPTADVLAKRFPGIAPDHWSPFFTRARHMLGASAPGDAGIDNAYPENELPAKGRALKKLAGGNTFRSVPITVALQERLSSGNVRLNECNKCGDCATGCNHGAKNSLDVGLLALAARRGAQIFTGGTVLRLRRHGTGWVVRAVPTERNLRNRHGLPTRIHAKHVILAAGSLGSTEILMRSQGRKLRFSERLGRAFSSNGDMLSVVYDGDQEVNAVANECTRPDDRKIGPTITSMIDLRAGEGEPCAIQEMAVPGPLRRVFEELFTTANLFQTLAKCDWDPHGNEAPGAMDPCAVDPNAIRRSSVIAVMGDDGGGGAIMPPEASRRFRGDGGVTINWGELRTGPHGTRDQSVFDRQTNALEALLPKNGRSRLLSNPAWRLLPKSMSFLMDEERGPPLTVHPLGGCAMGTSVATGVVNDCGQVFNPAGGVYESLVVLDGSVIPGALGINPALTISAVALRAAERLRGRWNLDAPSDELPLAPVARPIFARKSHNEADPDEHTFEISERLAGPAVVTLAGEGAAERFVEISVLYRPCALGPLMGTLHRRVNVLRHPKKSRIRVFRSEEAYRQACRPKADDPDREKRLDGAAEWDGELEGTLEFLHRERSFALQRIVRAGIAYLWNRGVRDIFGSRTPRGVKVGRAGIAVASRAGEARLFAYHLRTFLRRRDAENGAASTPACIIEGHKRLTYGINSNLFEQLETMKLTSFNGEPASGTLDLDLNYFAEEHTPLLRIEQQPNMASSLVEIAAFMAYIARIMISIHAWSFRRPEPRPKEPPQRLPVDIRRSYFERLKVGFKIGWFDPEPAGLIDRMKRGIAQARLLGERSMPASEPVPVAMGRRFGRDVQIQLKRYPRPGSKHVPVLMIHGYSASGTTFAHPAIEPSLAEFLWYHGRDIWVLDMRTSSGMPTADEEWTFEDAALNDIPAAVERVLRETGHQQLDIVAHCMGSAMLSMAVLAKPSAGERFAAARAELPRRIRRVVLSQVGPLMQFSPINVLRAYVMRYVQQYLGCSRFDFRIPDTPTLNEQLLDRFLSCLRYPPEERDWENYWFWEDNSFVGTRHRIDGLYGRSFSIKNLSKKVLAQIDDFFGPLNFKTVLQTQHFALGHVITDRAGNNVYLNRESRDALWTFPTLSLHGKDNGLMDVATRDWLHNYFNLDDATHEPLATRYVESLEFEATGHQDSLIGKPRTTIPIFCAMERFLERSDTLPPRSKPTRWLVVPPWAGPIRAPGTGTVKFALAWDPDMTPPDFLLCVAVKRVHGPRKYEAVPIWTDFGKARVQCSVFAFAIQGDAKGGWHNVELPEWLLAPNDADGVLLLHCHDQGVPLTAGAQVVVANKTFDIKLDQAQLDKMGKLAIDWSGEDGRLYGDARRKKYADAAGPRPIPVSLPAGNDEEQSVRDMLQELNEAGAMEQRIGGYLRIAALEELDAAFIRAYRPPANRGVADVVRIFAGSCQYPNGLMDETVAWRSYKCLGEVIAADEGDPTRRLLVLLGDQIYADATAGLFDPVLADDRYQQPYRDLLSRPEVRRVLRNIPAVMMLDDHELHENWEPGPGKLTNEDAQALHEGVTAYTRFQRGAGPDLHKDRDAYGMPFLWFDTKVGDVPLFVANTRTERQPRQLPRHEDWSMMLPPQMEALRAWLLRARRPDRGQAEDREVPKIVASPALIFPRRRTSSRLLLDSHWPERLDAGVISSDTWDGFPATLYEVLALIADNDIRNVIFLSGDEHMFLAARARVRNVERDWVDLRSIHASPLYAPYPFANSEKDDFLAKDRFQFTFRDGKYEFELVSTYFPPVRQGFVELRFAQGPRGAWNMWAGFYGCESPVLEYRWWDIPWEAKKEAPMAVRE